MSFKAQMVTDESAFLNLNEFAVSATVTTTTTSFSAVASLELGQVNGIGDLGGQTTMALIIVKKSDYANPQRYETVTIGADLWRIEDVPTGDDITWNLVVSRDRRIS